MSEVPACKLNLDNYYGPLDLLLHLVKETEVDVTAIALTRVCEQYIGFLSAMEKLDIDLSGNFLSLASQLLLIKSRALAPPEVVSQEEGAEGEEELEGDASLELIRKLLEYKRFKDRARALDHLGAERLRRFSRPHIRLEGETEQEPLRNLELWDLVLLYSKVAKGIRLDAVMSILYRDIPLEVFFERILNTLAVKKVATFTELMDDPSDRSQRLGNFLAILQLAKEQQILIEQDVDRGEIRIELAQKTSPPGERVDVDAKTPAAPPAAAAPADPTACPEPGRGAIDAAPALPAEASAKDGQAPEPTAPAPDPVPEIQG